MRGSGAACGVDGWLRRWKAAASLGTLAVALAAADTAIAVYFSSFVPIADASVWTLIYVALAALASRALGKPVDTAWVLRACVGVVVLWPLLRFMPWLAIKEMLQYAVGLFGLLAASWIVSFVDYFVSGIIFASFLVFSSQPWVRPDRGVVARFALLAAGLALVQVAMAPVLLLCTWLEGGVYEGKLLHGLATGVCTQRRPLLCGNARLSSSQGRVGWGWPGTEEVL